MRRTRVKTVEHDVLPRELLRSAPREVTFNGSGWVAAICAAVLAVGGVAGGLYLAETSRARAVQAAELRERGVRTDAEVTRVRRNRGDSPSVRVYYRFVAGERAVEGDTRLAKGDPMWRTVREGQRVRVVYLPDKPESSWLDGYGPKEIPLWLAALVPGVCVPGAVAIVAALRRQARLLVEGRTAMAIVTKAEKKSASDDNWRVEYSWRLLNGATHSAHVERSSKPAGAGTFVPVVYDREQPSRHALYPLSLVKVR